jgi:hypothetical protein
MKPIWLFELTALMLFALLMIPLFSAAPSLSALLVRPQSAKMFRGDSVQFCAFPKFSSGRIAERTQDRPWCDAQYATVRKGKPHKNEQALADSLCITWTVDAGTIETEICPIGLRNALRLQVAIR